MAEHRVQGQVTSPISDCQPPAECRFHKRGIEAIEGSDLRGIDVLGDAIPGSELVVPQEHLS